MNNLEVKVSGAKTLYEVMQDCGDYYIENKIVDIKFMKSPSFIEFNMLNEKAQVSPLILPSELVSAAVSQCFEEWRNLRKCTCFLVSSVEVIRRGEGLVEANSYFHLEDTYFVTLKFGKHKYRVNS